jgi:hypothetical protein
MAAGAALLLLGSCEKRMSYGDLDATRANALNGLARANAAMERVEELEGRVDEIEARLEM